MRGDSGTVARRWRGTQDDRGYGRDHVALRARLNDLVLAGGVRCWRCGELIEPGTPWHLGHDDHDRSVYRGPEHRACNLGAAKRRWMAPPVEAVAELEGVGAKDPRWDVPWLRGLRRVPRDATWPRYMTVPHPRAVGSLGREFVRFAEGRSGFRLRWWQRLVATRLLEVDSDDRLVWETLVLSMARQLGKSWLLRELLLWRIHQGERFGEPQDVLHTGKDLAVCKEVQRPARIWAKARKDAYRVREVNGQEEIEFRADGSRWMLRAKEAVYGYGVSVGAADEAWKVRAGVIDEGLVPTMVEREQPQLLLVSTAHRKATSLMLTRRAGALEQLESGEGDLLIEWSVSPAAELEDVAGWRLASPHWTPRRERLVRRQLEAAQTGTAELAEDEMDPVEAFRCQWLNQWPTRLVPTGVTESLLPAGLWGWLAEPGLAGTGDLFVAVEDLFGRGAAVAAAAQLEDGRLEVDGWLCVDWDTAILDVQRLAALRPIRVLQVGASMLERVPAGMTPSPRPAGTVETRAGLPLLRDLAANGMLAHDETTVELDAAVEAAQVKELASGLALAPLGDWHLVKALVWAVASAHRPSPVPAIH